MLNTFEMMRYGQLFRWTWSRSFVFRLKKQPSIKILQKNMLDNVIILNEQFAVLKYACLSRTLVNHSLFLQSKVDKDSERHKMENIRIMQVSSFLR